MDRPQTEYGERGSSYSAASASKDGSIKKRVSGTLLSNPPAENSGLVALLTVMLVLCISALAWNDPFWYGRLAASGEAIFQSGEYERLFSAVLVHSDTPHFLANAVFLGLFSYLLFGYFGTLAFPLLTVPTAALANYFALWTYPPEVRLVGASGLVYVMAAFWLTMYVLVERSRSIKRRLLHALGVTLIILVPSAIQENVSYRTHAIGFGLGVVTAGAFFSLRRKQIQAAEEREPAATNHPKP